MNSSSCAILCLLILFVGCSARRDYPLPSENQSTKKPLQTFRPFNVAHRGSNGEIPEETAPAYLEFADRVKTFEVEGANQTGLFIFDFTLKELKTLRTKQRFDFRDQQYNGCTILCLLILFVGCSARRLYPLPSQSTKKPLQTFRPFNVAHRGSNGEIPEETAPAYLRAIEEGADFIETDILSSKDGVLMCLHDETLDDTTDVAEHKEFADRVKTFEVEGANKTGLFIFDFTLKELKTLRTKQRFDFRDKQYN
nr:glycerophosphodiester phosphodiesterase GDPD6 [Tanacetum cinerariifolium]